MRPRARSSFPSFGDAPLALLRVNGNCGLLAAWTVLTYFRKRVSSATLIRRCAYSARHGVYTIGIACALAEAGLGVEFRSDVDPDPTPLERRLTARAKRLGVRLLPALDVPTLVERAGGECVPIVFYDGANGEGHFSPLLGVDGGDLLLPHSALGTMPKEAFRRASRAPGIFRQAVVARPA